MTSPEFLIHVRACHITDLKWDSPPTTALLIKKRGDREATEHLQRIAEYLKNELNVEPIVEPHADMHGYRSYSMSDLPLPFHAVSFIVCVGGDGTLLHANSLFADRIPPVVAFFFGTLGFLTPYKLEDYKETLSHVVEGKSRVALRSRLYAQLRRKEPEAPVQDEKVECDPCSCENEMEKRFPEDESHLDEDETKSENNSKEYFHHLSGTPDCATQSAPDRSSFYVLNEVVVDRGPSPFLTEVDTYCNGYFMTSVRADGLILSTPTGSTAYSLAAGGAMVHPSVPSMLFTPISPHSLSFRPVIFSESTKLRVRVPDEARSSAWASFDGRFRTELVHGDSLRVSTSRYPLPLVTSATPTVQWMHDLGCNLNWNQSNRQTKKK